MRCIQSVKFLQKLCKIHIQPLHFPRTGKEQAAEGPGSLQTGSPPDRACVGGADRADPNPHHFLPDGDEFLVKGEQKQHIIPVADSIVNPAVDGIYHMAKDRVHAPDCIRLAGEAREQSPKYLVIGVFYKALGQRKGNAGITFHNIAVVQNDHRFLVSQSGNRANLEQPELSVFPGIFQITFHRKDTFHLLGNTNQFLDAGIVRKGSIAGLLIIIYMIGQIVVAGSRIGPVLYHLISGSGAKDDNGFI